MEVNSINYATQRNRSGLSLLEEPSEAIPKAKKLKSVADDSAESAKNSVSFKGGGKPSKYFWFSFRKIADYMKESNEMVSNVIQFFGTALIAPFAIMVSPSKGDAAKLPKKDQREKKKFQALRQPVSAVLAFGFQGPTTIGMKKLFNHLAYEKHAKMFDDEILGSLVPSKKFLQDKVIKSLSKDFTEADIAKIGGFDGKIDLNAAKEELKNKIKADYTEVGLEISEEKLEKLASNKRKFRNHVAEKIAAKQHDVLLDQKVKEMSTKNLVINDMDLVTQSFQDLMKNDYKEEFKALEKNANLNIIDKFLDSLGIPSKKMKAFKEAEEKLAREKGLEYLKKTNPGLFKDPNARVKNFIENRTKKAQEVFKRKTDLITLAVNVGVFAVSCLVLNWIHPKFVKWIEGGSKKNNEPNPTETKKVEVAA